MNHFSFDLGTLKWIRIGFEQQTVGMEVTTVIKLLLQQCSCVCQEAVFLKNLYKHVGRFWVLEQDFLTTSMLKQLCFYLRDGFKNQ